MKVRTVNFAVTSKLELNLSDPTVPLPIATELANKNHMAAIVIYEPNLVLPLIQQRMSSNGRWKIIQALDFPNGYNYVLEKFKQLPKEFRMTNFDGFDILLSSKTYNGNPPNEIEVKNEIDIVRNFIMAANKQIEVRFVIDALSRSPQLVDYALKAFKMSPPTFIRLDHNLEMPATKCNVETLTKAIDNVKKHTAIPIKVSTNVDLAMIKHFNNIPRFDVSVKQAEKILKEIQKQEETPSVKVAPDNTPR